MKMLLVAIIHPYFDVIGGAEVTSLSLINSLVTKGIQTNLYCVKPPKIEESQYFSVHKIKQKKTPMFWRLQKLMEVKQLFDSASNCEIIFVTSGGLTMSKCNAKKIFVYCNSSFSSEIKFLEEKFYGIKGVYLKIIQNHFNECIKYLKEENVELIANSDFTRKEIEKNIGKKSLLIYPPVSITKFKQNVKKKQGVVTISRFSIEKNLEKTIEIFNRVNFSCELVGNTKHKNQFRILKQLQSQKRDNVKIHSNISKTKIREILKSAKVYLHTSQETFGISVVEGIAAGCIPIVPDNSAHKETVPFEELRYREIDEAVKKIHEAMMGNFDNLLPKLSAHIEKFSDEIFQKNMIELINRNCIS